MGENGSGLSGSDVLAIADRNNDNTFGGGNAFFWVFALMLLGNGGFGNWGNGRGGNFVTDQDLQISQNAQTQQLQMNELTNQNAQNKFDIAQVINGQTDALIAQNNSNLINAIQGFNNLGAQITNQTNVLSGQLMQLSAKMDSCCCEIKTQMLQDRLSDEQAKNVTLQNAIDNANQSQYLLGQLGRFVAWAGSGAATASAAG